MKHDQILKALKSRFHLVGSRALGLADDKSDWDFAGWSSDYLESVLKDLGFTKAQIPKRALDNITVSVWQLRSFGACYQVVLVNDLDAKLGAMEALKACPELAQLDRSLRGGKTVQERHSRRNKRRRLWNTLFDLTTQNSC